jgi:hypothetical protein
MAMIGKHGGYKAAPGVGFEDKVNELVSTRGKMMFKK